MTEAEYSRGMEGAVEARKKLGLKGWVDLVEAARLITMDAMSLDDLPAVALAIARMEKLRARLGSVPG